MKNIPAFPQATQIANEFHPNYGKDAGMTMRDYFAAKVLQGLLASGLDQPKFEFARKSYEMADAMMEARNAAQ